MKTLASLALGASLLLQTTSAQYSLNPHEVPRLTLATNYTFHALCDTLQNPDPFFDELKLQRIVNGYANNLSMYLQGAWSAATTTSRKNESPQSRRNYIAFLRSLNSGIASGVVQTIPEGDEKLDCATFQANLLKFSQVFQDMAYAIGEKCYRQCHPSGFSYRAIAQLRCVFEKSPYGSFYQQVRMIEEHAGCSFEDTFLVEPERAIDRVQLRLTDFKSFRSPCADLAERRNNEASAVPAARPQHGLKDPSRAAEPTVPFSQSRVSNMLNVKAHSGLQNPLGRLTGLEREQRKRAVEEAAGAVIIEEE